MSWFSVLPVGKVLSDQEADGPKIRSISACLSFSLNVLVYSYFALGGVGGGVKMDLGCQHPYT